MNLLKIDAASSIPKGLQIESYIRSEVESGRLKPGTKLPSMQQLAKQLGVSLGIIKQALHTLTVEGTLRSTPKVGVFVSERRPTQDIALVLPSVEFGQIARIVRGARLSLPDSFRLIIEAATNDFDSQIDLIKYLNHQNIAGILLMTPPKRHYAARLKEVLPVDMPCVQILYELANLPADSVTFDGFEVGEIAVNHLTQNGHTEIGLVTTDADLSTFINRNKGMDSALQKIGKSYETMPKEITQAEDMNLDESPSQRAADRLLRKHPELTAIIGANGGITLGIIQAIKDSGKTIPDDISVISMGVDLSSFKHMTPAITALDEPLEKMCRRATQLLIDRIEKPRQGFRSIQFAPILNERESVGKPANRKEEK